MMDFISRRHDVDSSARPISTPDNHGPLLNVVSWFLGVCNITAVVSRVLSKAIYSKNLGLDDILICVALLFAIGQVTAFSYGVYYGAGRHIYKLSQEEIVGYQKAIYASNILWHSTQVFSKLSITSFVRSISPTQWNKKGSTVAYGVTLVWGVTALLLICFRCNTPNTWQTIGNVCLDIHYAWGYVNSMNIIIDLFLIVLPYSVLWKVQLPIRKKVLVFSFFGARIVAVAAMAYQWYRTREVDPLHDVTFDMWVIDITMSITQTADLVTASVPFLKPLVDGLESGMIRTTDLRHRTLTVGTSRHNAAHPDTRRDPEGYLNHMLMQWGRFIVGHQTTVHRGTTVMIPLRGLEMEDVKNMTEAASEASQVRGILADSQSFEDRCQIFTQQEKKRALILKD